MTDREWSVSLLGYIPTYRNKEIQTCAYASR